MDLNRKFRAPVQLGIHDETAFTGDHLAYFYESDEEFDQAFGFVETGLRGTDHCIIFGIADDTDRMLGVLGRRGWDTADLIARGQLSILRPLPTCDATVAAVARHFERVLGAGAHFVRFIGNAAVGRDGWPSQEEFYKLEATVSTAVLGLPCVAICMFDLRSQSAQTIMKAAFEGHPLTFHRNCIRENPFYQPKGEGHAGGPG
jgi:DcmR-like sensory protein